MGIHIISTGSDFSALGLGNVNLSEKYIETSGITDVLQKAAIRAFYVNFKDAGFLDKFDVFRLFFTGTALGDSLNIVNPILGVSAHQATFINDNPTYHTTSGWTPNGAALSYGKSNFLLNGDLKFFHAHAWNVTPESGGAADNKFLLGSNASAGSNDHYITIQRNGQNKTKGSVSSFSSITTLGSTTGSVGGTGLLSISRQNTVLKLYDAGTILVSGTDADTPTLSGVSEIKEGTIDTATNSAITTCKLRCLGYGFSTWTDSDEVNLQYIINSFNSLLT